MKTSRFWTPVLVSLAATPILLCLGVAPTGAGHGSYFPLSILFPFLYAMLTNRLVHSNLVFILLALVQFPGYGAILGLANAKRKLIPAACVLFAIHVSAIGSIYAPYVILLHAPTRLLIEAVQHDDVKTVKRILEEGGDPNTHTPGGSSLLETACNHGNQEMARLLLDKGANINYVSRYQGHTALHEAVQFRKEKIIQLLLSKGADVTIKDRDGYTALERAKKERDSGIKLDPRWYPDSDLRAGDERLISLLESAARDQKKP